MSHDLMTTDPSDIASRADAVQALNIAVARTPNVEQVFQGGQNKIHRYPKDGKDPTSQWGSNRRKRVLLEREDCNSMDTIKPEYLCHTTSENTLRVTRRYPSIIYDQCLDHTSL